MQGHKHTDSGHTHVVEGLYSMPSLINADFIAASAIPGGVWQPGTSTGYANIGLPTKYDDNYKEPRISTENKPKSITVRYWKRTA